MMRGTKRGMKRGLFALVVAACGASAPPAPAPPPGPSACARASDNLVHKMLARLTPSDTPPTEQADAIRNLIRERCEADQWSDAATRCLIALADLDGAAACAEHMTDEQQAALVRGHEALFGRAGAAPRPETN